MKLSAYLLISVAAMATATAAQAASTTGSALATVAQALSVSETTGMNFGTFSVDTAGTINTSGGVSGGVVTIGGPFNPGIFEVQGGDSAAYVVSGDPTVSLDDGGPGVPMVADLTYPSGTQILNASGMGTFNVTGLLHVNAAQAAGNYTGSYNVNVNY